MIHPISKSDFFILPVYAANDWRAIGLWVKTLSLILTGTFSLKPRLSMPPVGSTGLEVE
ncbi:MAG: hypothetical protein PHG00_15720 [Methylococcales bacterium]|nr:hypothetical protein [Methylococcales bacterium]